MELLIAFLLAFGAISEEGAHELKSVEDAKQFIVDKDIKEDYEKWIWEAEADDF